MPNPLLGPMYLPPAPCPPAPVDTDDNGCEADGGGSEPICCGLWWCSSVCPVMSEYCLDGRATRIHIGMSEGCGNVSSQWIDGILCCKDNQAIKST